MTWPTISVGARFDKSGFTWTELGDYAERISIRTGRQRFLERYNAGSITVELDNSDRRFDPLNLSGPYVSGGETQVEPMVQILVTATHDATDHYLKIGFADDWDTQPAFPSNAICVVSATDGFKVLALADPPELTVAAGTKVGNAMATLVPSSSYISSSGIDTTSQQPTVAALTITTSVLAALQSLADTDRGDLFMRPAFVGGRVVDRIVFRPYSQRCMATSSATFSDDPGVGEFLYEAVRPLGTNDDQFVTTVTGQRTGGTAVTESFAAAKTKNMGVDRPKSNTSLLHQDDDQVRTWVEGVLHRFRVFEAGFARMDIDLAAQDDDDLWAFVLDASIGDRITVVHTPPGGGTAISRDHFIEGIEHDIVLPAREGTRGRGWRASFTLSDASRFFTDVMVLDNVTRGLLDTGRLGF